jgi:pyruvate dehydrogenase (quinone)
MRRGMMGSLSGGLASLGAATPCAMAAKMAHPERVVIAFIGDGAMQMNGLNVMITISKYWKLWSDPRLIVMVLNNRDLSQVTWEERVLISSGKTHAYAQLLGLKGIFVDNPEKLGDAWDEALAADRPVTLECYTDPNVPPLPPHITLKQAKSFMQSLSSEPELAEVLKNSFRQVFSHLIPGGKH